MVTCVREQELLGPADDSKFQPNEENVEALCQLLITVGKQFDESPTSRCKNDEYFRQLNDMSTSTQLAPLLRFMIRDLLDLRANNWVARPKEVKAKNITEKYSESQNLGDNSPGGFLPMTKTTARLNNLQSKTVSLVEEYFNVRLLDKALKCVKELNSPAYHPEVVKEAISLGLEKNPPCAEPVAKLLEYLFAEKVVADGDIELGCLLYGSMLDDVSLDVPKAPNGFGKIIGKLVLAGVLDFTVVNKVVMKVEDERLQKTISGAAVRIANSTSGQCFGIASI
nr:eukaryotic translation initiation factor-like [Quercus suber]POE91775.1 isoform 2 of eukaryotic translation initiation factor isoform 4g-1 [Quercus suber]